MKKYILIILTLIISILPLTLNAEIETETLLEALEKEGIESKINYKESDEQVTVYFFRRQGEQKCIDFLNYLNDTYERYGMFYKVRIYEIGSNTDNLTLMHNLFDYLRNEDQDAPFIVVGGTWFVTYNESVNHNFEKTIIETYQSQVREDKIEEVLVKYYRNYNLITGVVISIFIISFILILYLIIKNYKENKKVGN